MTPPPITEKLQSQIPALQLLINLGYTYLTPEEALKLRYNRTSEVVLEEILSRKLKEINRIRYKGMEYLFSEENIQSAVQRLKNIRYDGLQTTNQEVYDILTLGESFEQTINGDKKSFHLNYIDWKNPDNNSYHVTAEFPVERTKSERTARPDIVLFVNGIPLVVIECKSPKNDVEEAVSQSLRNQGKDYIPKLFMYAQIVLGINKNRAMYATAGTTKKFWSIWKEEPPSDEIINRSLPDDIKDKLYSGDFETAGWHFKRLQESGGRIATEQDTALYSLCRPERLIELTHRFIIFDAGIKKIARYQQYFVIKSTLERIRTTNEDNRRRGGIIWHTQGSGKSLTMVMLARNIALDKELNNPRIVIVTDRTDLDTQLKNTFTECGLEPKKATSGRNLLELVSEEKTGIITTLVHKFDKALNIKKYRNESSEIIILVDEGHRTQSGSLSGRMRQMFPNACYIGFTGTPLLKKEKNSFERFGGLISPHYSISQAVEDKAVVPLLYEGRLVDIEQDKKAIDTWFERYTKDLTREQMADLKRKYARAEELNKADRVIYMRAYDISDHFCKNWKGTGFKGQLIAPNKASAVTYLKYLREIGEVSAEVIISPPDMREGYDEAEDESKDQVVAFWKKMMERYRNADEYTTQIINQFKHGEEPEIIIVVDKLITGFDAPVNTVMYLCRNLREHTLLQAIARVNRVHEGKDFGYIIDYAGILGKLDEALTMYSAFEGFDPEDVEGTVISVKSEIEKLPQYHSDLLDIFKDVPNVYDEEAYEVHLSDKERRDRFYGRLFNFSKCLSVALSSEHFMLNTSDSLIKRYKNDLKRFTNLKASVKLRYADSIDYRDYEPKIKKLIDTNIKADEVIQLNEPVNIFDREKFSAVKEELGIYNGKSTVSRADIIAHATKRKITEKMDEDPAFYKKFSDLIQEAIDDFRARRISEIDYYNRVVDLKEKVTKKEHENVPDDIQENYSAMAYYGAIDEILRVNNPDEEKRNQISAEIALKVCKSLKAHNKVQFWEDEDAKNCVRNDIDDYLYDVVKDEIDLSTGQMTEIIDKTLHIAKKRECYE
ncbi:type I restriction endonuclease subunit R [Methanoplanus endosymbiosus]|uniref:type I site-specific deoxyribonuclease n=1 Tax=Methanoplanus endosymbiosus TaxID=33865 RepID=A0A9E7TLI7_9EURY|nr:type I restriction endonuclease subunit R [Methanoplanus endosymbiosus]UUX93810.1 type I restriction endonuclease subunit R [Methanoplanus endosymbiosus]